ncbi:MAG: hypothetical protein IPH33_05520 [Bacteroidetes bacterium]|nr:hypothetical protein [Bacteroidota bacterium]
MEVAEIKKGSLPQRSGNLVVDPMEGEASRVQVKNNNSKTMILSVKPQRSVFQQSIFNNNVQDVKANLKK